MPKRTGNLSDKIGFLSKRNLKKEDRNLVMPGGNGMMLHNTNLLDTCQQNESSYLKLARILYIRACPILRIFPMVLQGKNITLPECPGQVNFDCGHVDFCCTGPAGMFFLLSFSIKNFTNHTHLCILPGNGKVWAYNFCNRAGNFLGYLSIGQVCFKLCSCPVLKPGCTENWYKYCDRYG